MVPSVFIILFVMNSWVLVLVNLFSSPFWIADVDASATTSAKIGLFGCSAISAASLPFPVLFAFLPALYSALPINSSATATAYCSETAAYTPVRSAATSVAIVLVCCSARGVAICLSNAGSSFIIAIVVEATSSLSLG